MQLPLAIDQLLEFLLIGLRADLLDVFRDLPLLLGQVARAILQVAGVIGQPFALRALETTCRIFDLVLRGAYYKTYVRPQDRQFSPVTRIGERVLNSSQSTSTMSIYNASVRIGNNKLQPYLADSVDVSLEWYNRPGGLLALAYFRKVITGRIVGTSDPAILCPADGSTWGFGTLSWDGQYCTATSLATSNSSRKSVILPASIFDRSRMSFTNASWCLAAEMTFSRSGFRDFAPASSSSSLTISV